MYSQKEYFEIKLQNQGRDIKARCFIALFSAPFSRTAGIWGFSQDYVKNINRVCLWEDAGESGENFFTFFHVILTLAT